MVVNRTSCRPHDSNGHVGKRKIYLLICHSQTFVWASDAAPAILTLLFVSIKRRGIQLRGSPHGTPFNLFNEVMI